MLLKWDLLEACSMDVSMDVDWIKYRLGIIHAFPALCFRKKFQFFVSFDFVYRFIT